MELILLHPHRSASGGGHLSPPRLGLRWVPGPHCLHSAKPQALALHPGATCSCCKTSYMQALCLQPELVQQHHALPFLPHSHSRPCQASIIGKNPKMAYFWQGRPLGVAILRVEGQLMPPAPKLPTPVPWPAPLALPASPAPGGLAAAGKKKRLLSLIPQGSDKKCHPLLGNTTQPDKNLYQARTYGWLQNTEPGGAG